VKDKGVVSLIRSSTLMHGRQKSSALIALDSIKVSIVRARSLRFDVWVAIFFWSMSCDMNKHLAARVG
jgi:hypothetical protein